MSVDIHREIAAVVGNAFGAALNQKAHEWQAHGASGADVIEHIRGNLPALRQIYASAVEAAYDELDRQAGIAGSAIGGLE